jgi:hypothetical protein
VAEGKLAFRQEKDRNTYGQTASDSYGEENTYGLNLSLQGRHVVRLNNTLDALEGENRQGALARKAICCKQEVSGDVNYQRPVSKQSQR